METTFLPKGPAAWGKPVMDPARSLSEDNGASLASSAAGSSLLLTLSMLVLKQELEERGKGPDAAAYAWHICTFALGLGALLAPSRRPEPAPPAPTMLVSKS